MTNAPSDPLPLIQSLERLVPDPTRGLPEPVFRFATRITPMVNVDLLIQDEAGRTLLTWREGEIYLPGWHIPGGIIRYKETWADRILAVAAGELGTTIRFDPVPMTVREVIHPDRKDRGHFISLLFRCELTGPLDASRRHPGGKPAHGCWAWHERCPHDLLDVQEMYRPYF